MRTSLKDMELGHDGMLLNDSAHGTIKVAEAFATMATDRGLGVQGKKTAARIWGAATSSILKICGTPVKFLTQTVLYDEVISDVCLHPR